ncbi:hypothetical protein NIES22_02240 [Calothrix brevissima NIES-22]|nr:hypothetical protein NIES22_02240 [Calothrix brevissima NIES-22]
MKTSVYRNAAVLACSVGLLGLLVGCLGMSVSFETTNPDSATSPPNGTSEVASNVSSAVAHETLTSTNVSDSVTTASSKVEDSTSQVTTRLAYRQDSIGTAKDRGTLRLSNQTNQPVRIALLARKSQGNSAPKNQQEIPAHWDFAPQEGSEKGLLLSLPTGNLKLEKGDVVVAFAQDGSRRYWGPYVVGETSLPKWDSQKQEWLLILNQ